MTRHTRTAAIAATFALLSLFPSGADAQPSPSRARCDATCLQSTMTAFKQSLLAARPVTLAAKAEVRQNMVVIPVQASVWRDAKSVRSTMVFTDPTTGNVISRDGVEMKDGKPAYISTRLKVDGGQVVEAEFEADLNRAKLPYVWNLPTMFTEVLPPERRMSRADLEALARRYFQTLTDHKAIKSDFDDVRCNRFHSGNQITNVTNDTVEAQGARTCSSSNDGPKPWGPATELRLPIIDTSRGIVVGQILLLYAKQVMYVTEVFKVDGGKIVNIDNIGVVEPGLDHTTGFGMSHDEKPSAAG